MVTFVYNSPVLDSVLRVRQVVLFPVTVAVALIGWGIIGILVWFGLGIFLIGTR